MTPLGSDLILGGDDDRAAALGGLLRPVADRARGAEDGLFWQWPGRTEGAAWDLHRDLRLRPEADDWHLYLGLPWATWLDRRRIDAEQSEMALEFSLQRSRLRAWRQRARAQGRALHAHTVCQHIEWRSLLPLWREIGLTDIWLSHAPGASAEPAAWGLRLHPWRLLAVNVEDPQRRQGLDIGRPCSQRQTLASFVGAHAEHYLSDVRLRLRALELEPGFVIDVGRGWHFEGVVYGHQIAGQALADSYMIDDSVAAYNRLLSESVFALCPSGAGPNTLRLWEALAVGAIPVLLGVMPELPQGGSLAPLNWDEILLQIPDPFDVTELPAMLRAMPVHERMARQRKGLAAFAAVRAQRCFAGEHG